MSREEDVVKEAVLLADVMVLQAEIDEIDNASCFVVVTEWDDNDKVYFSLTGPMTTLKEAEDWADDHRVEMNMDSPPGDEFRVYVKPVSPHTYEVKS